MRDATPLPLLGARRQRSERGFLWQSIVNGPVHSRRFGVSLGLNLLPPGSKVCSCDCRYCECGFYTPRAPGARWPSPDEVAHSLRCALTRLSRSPDWITFAGNGEPTLHPRFPIVVERGLGVRRELAARTGIAIFSNGLAAGKPAVRAALCALDARLLKLDPGPMEQVNGVRYAVERLVQSYRALRPFTIQAMVVKGRAGTARAPLVWPPG